MADQPDITLLTILQHMQVMEQRLMRRIAGVDTRLSNRMDRMHASLTRQIDAIKIENLPKRVKALEKVVLA